MYVLVKRIFDILFSTFLIILLSPVFIIVSILIKLDSEGEVIFKQSRIGRNKEKFNVYKFRTMYKYAPSDKPTWMLKKPESNITRIGKKIRPISIDELPQLFNILKGDMSLIGPRPVIEAEVDLIEERDKYNANSVLPGLTGLAQINGRDNLGYKEKAKYDGIYVENFSFRQDFKIFFKTILYVIKKEDIVEGKRKFSGKELEDKFNEKNTCNSFNSIDDRSVQ